jgi:hypothetical protein
LLKSAAAVLERALEIVSLAQAIQTHRDRETVSFEKGGILLSQQSAVGGNREANVNAAFPGQVCRVFRRRAQHPAIGQRFAAEKG